MKKIVTKYKISKFKRFLNGLLFAIITVISLSLCLHDISGNKTSQIGIILPFAGSIISMLFGFIAMFHNSETRKAKKV